MINHRHRKILEGFLKDSTFEVLNTEFREMQPGLVLATVFWKLNGFRTPSPDLTKPGSVREGIFTHVFIQQKEKWEITATQNTLKP